MRSARRAHAGALLLSMSCGLPVFMAGCTDESRQDGTLVPYDAKKYEEGQRKMQEYMQKKAQGQIPGFPRTAPSRK